MAWILGSALLDGLVLCIVLFATIELPNRSSKAIAAVYLCVSLALLAPTYLHGRIVPRPAEALRPVAIRLALAPLLTAAITLTRDYPRIVDINTQVYLQLTLVTIAAVMAGRVLMFQVMQVGRSRGFDLEDTLIVGAGATGVEVAQALQDNPEFGLLPLGFVERFDDDLDWPIVGRPEHLASVIRATGVRHVVLAFGSASEQELVAQVRACAHLPVQFYAVPRFFELGQSVSNLCHEVDGFALVPLRRGGRRRQTWQVKRIFDVVFAGILLVLTFPIMALCALAVRLSSPGPVLFRQSRVSTDNQPFEILKFRSMKVNDDHATTWTVDGDARVTPVGRFLRKSHLDELPQLWNVLRGDMSVVGPRPERPYYVEQYSAQIQGYGDRHRVPAGITGWAQVNGYWGDTSIEARVRLDNRYIENWSLWRDIVIALRTIPTLLGRRR